MKINQICFFFFIKYKDVNKSKEIIRKGRKIHAFTQKLTTDSIWSGLVVFLLLGSLILSLSYILIFFYTLTQTQIKLLLVPLLRVWSFFSNGIQRSTPRRYRVSSLVLLYTDSENDNKYKQKNECTWPPPTKYESLIGRIRALRVKTKRECTCAVLSCSWI